MFTTKQYLVKFAALREGCPATRGVPRCARPRPDRTRWRLVLC